MIILIIFAILLLLFIALLFFSYRMVFMHPFKIRPNARQIPESNLYKDHISTMLKGVEETEIFSYKPLEILSHDGYRLYGKLYIQKANAPLFIFFHGYHGVAAWDGYGTFRFCKEHNYNILLVDMRAHGKSEGDITFGIKERYDCKKWVQYALELLGNNTDIILSGVSMGAATITMASALDLPANVKAIISDCCFSEPSAIIKETIKSMKLPPTPTYAILKLGARLFGKFNPEESSPLLAVQNITLPVLFIHGSEDSIVPIEMCNTLYKNCISPKEQSIINGADHANCALVNFEAYKKAVIKFIENVL